MYYFVLAGRVIAKYEKAEDVLNHKPILIESDDDSIEPYKASHIDGNFVKDSTYIDDSLALLLKLSAPVNADDISNRDNLLNQVQTSQASISAATTKLQVGG